MSVNNSWQTFLNFSSFSLFFKTRKLKICLCDEVAVFKQTDTQTKGRILDWKLFKIQKNCFTFVAKYVDERVLEWCNTSLRRSMFFVSIFALWTRNQIPNYFFLQKINLRTKQNCLAYFENVCKQKESKSINSPKFARLLTSYSFKIPRKNMPGLLGPFFLAVL